MSIKEAKFFTFDLSDLEEKYGAIKSLCPGEDKEFRILLDNETTLIKTLDEISEEFKSFLLGFKIVDLIIYGKFDNPDEFKSEEIRKILCYAD